MKTIARLLLALVASFMFTAGILTADETFYWNPTDATIPASMGGPGIWDNTNPLWYNGTSTIAKGTNASADTFGGINNADSGTSFTTYGSTTLIFQGNGTITKNGISYFNGGSASGTNFATRTLNFGTGNTFTLTTSTEVADDGLTIAGGNGGAFVFNVGLGSTLNIQATTGKKFNITTGTNLTGGNALVFQGGGTTNLADTNIILSSPNSRTNIFGGTTVNLNAGTSIYASGASAAAPLSTGRGHRINVQDGTLNLNGADISLGYRAISAQANDAAYGLVIGYAAGANATVNINSGTLTAIGDARNPGATLSTGVNFGTATDGTHILNLNGGTLITTDIRSGGGTTTKELNLNGGTIVVSTQVLSGETGTTTTNAQLQTRLDNFIQGFAQTGAAGVFVGPNGITIDTSQIDTTRTNGVAAITASLRDSADGAGTLTKIGANTLLIAGYHAYTGNISIEGGTLAVGNTAGTDTSSSIARVGILTIKNGTIFDTTRQTPTDTKGYKSGTDVVQQIITNEGTGKIVGKLNLNYGRILPNGTFTIDGDFNSTTNRGFIQIDNLDTDLLNITGTLTLENGVTFDLSNASISAEQTYTLALAQTITYGNILFEGADLFTFDISKGNQGALETLQITAHAIPEPSTYAAILGLLILTALIIRRRK